MMTNSLPRQSAIVSLLLFCLSVSACSGGSGSSTTVDGAAEDNNAGGGADSPSDEVSRPPNILLIIADDMGLDASPVHSEGLFKPNMPVLENLSKNGITFDNFWTNPLCAPTRATILTGKYGIHSGVLGVTAPYNGVSTSEVSLQSYLKDKASYSSAVIGKWHLSNDSNGGANNPEYMGVEYYEGLLNGAHKDYYDWTLTKNGKTSNVQQYSTSYFTDKGIDWIAEQSADEPWFLWLAYTAPHTPFHLPPKELITDQSLSGDADDIEKNPLSYYLAMLEALDSEVGRLLKTVDMDNTVVIFIGDNGTPALAVQSPYSRTHAKGSVYEGGVNSPMVVSGYGVDRTDERESALINSTDLYATIAELAEIDVTDIHDSISFKAALGGASYAQRQINYAEVASDNSAWAIRDQQYKLIEFSGGWQEFYDLSDDPYENKDLIDAGLNDAQITAKETLEAKAAEIRAGD